METVLEQWSKRPREPFVSKPRYYTVGDFVIYFKEDKACIARPLNPYVTMFRDQDYRTVGIQIWSVKKWASAIDRPIYLDDLLRAIYDHHPISEVFGVDEGEKLSRMVMTMFVAGQVFEIPKD